MSHAKPTRSRSRAHPKLEALESRALMAATPVSTLAMTSATTTDSRGVTIEFDVSGAPLTKPLTFNIDRSATQAVDPSTVVLSTHSFVPSTLDQNNLPIGAVGHHKLTIPLADGLPPAPSKPNVIVVADPENALGATSKSHNTASFHTDVIGVIVHGGIQPRAWKTSGPPWESTMANGLRSQRYDHVIAYNWVIDSNHPGSVPKQAPRLVKEIETAAAAFPANDVVDLHLIGHSEGTVINSLVVQKLNRDGWPANMKSGYVKMTILDPHPANNASKTKQYDVTGGFVGWLARQEINSYQSKAKDPGVVVPANVNKAEVYYQHTPVKEATGSNKGMYNLWGDVPINGTATYVDLTGPGISHAGAFGVMNWYNLNVVPTLSRGSSATVAPSPLTVNSATIVNSSIAVGSPSPIDVSGTSEPGAKIQIRTVDHPLVVLWGPHQTTTVIGSTFADQTGHWSVETKPTRTTTDFFNLHRIVVKASVPTGRRGAFVSQTTPLGTVTTT